MAAVHTQVCSVGAAVAPGCTAETRKAHKQKLGFSVFFSKQKYRILSITKLNKIK